MIAEKKKQRNVMCRAIPGQRSILIIGMCMRGMLRAAMRVAVKAEK